MEKLQRNRQCPRGRMLLTSLPCDADLKVIFLLKQSKSDKLSIHRYFCAFYISSSRSRLETSDLLAKNGCLPSISGWESVMIYFFIELKIPSETCSISSPIHKTNKRLNKVTVHKIIMLNSNQNRVIWHCRLLETLQNKCSFSFSSCCFFTSVSQRPSVEMNSMCFGTRPQTTMLTRLRSVNR